MKKKLTKKKKILSITVLLAAGAIATVLISIKSGALSSEEAEFAYKETTVQEGNIIYGITESGSVTVGSLEQTFDLELSSSSTTSSNEGNIGNNASGGTGSSSSLEVEEVYVSTGQTVSEGDALLKLTDESVEDAREILESNVSTASVALSEARLSAASSNLSAQYNYNSNVTNGSVAESKYNATITALQNAVTSAQQAVDSSAAKIADYQTRIAAGENCATALAEEQVNYSTLCAKLTEAQNNLTTKSVQAQEEYDEAMLNYNNASALYSVDTNGISSTVSDAQDALSDAKDALSEFEEAVGDGYIYAEYSGTVMSVGYAVGDDLSSSTAIATYSDTSSVTISVAVTEEDISYVAVGDSVLIELVAYEDETFDGVVTGIDTSSSSGSSTVDYTVTASFTGDVSKVYADMTGDVTFVIDQVNDVLYVSEKALIENEDATYVDIMSEDGSIERVEVTTGFSNGQYIEIQSGLEKGQTALIESQVSTE